MKTEAKNRLLMSRADVTARRDAVDADCASWVWVIPLGSGGGFRIRAFEVRRELLINDDDIYDGNMAIVYDEVVETIDEVDRSVAAAGADPADLAAPWNNDFPL